MSCWPRAKSLDCVSASSRPKATTLPIMSGLPLFTRLRASASSPIDSRASPGVLPSPARMPFASADLLPAREAFMRTKYWL